MNLIESILDPKTVTYLLTQNNIFVNSKLTKFLLLQIVIIDYYDDS